MCFIFWGYAFPKIEHIFNYFDNILVYISRLIYNISKLTSILLLVLTAISLSIIEGEVGMCKKNKVIVRIGGREYAMRGVESEEYIHKVAIYVDKMMESIASKQPPLSTSMLAILTAINLSDEIIKQKSEIENLQRELNEAKAAAKSADKDRVNILDMPKKIIRP